LNMERLTTASTPYVLSVQEAVERNLRLVVDPADESTDVTSPQRSVPGLLTTRSREQAGAIGLVSPSWAAEAARNELMFEHRAFGPMLLHHATQAAVIPAGGSVNIDELYGRAAEALVQAFAKPAKSMPAELRKRLRREQVDVVEALLEWSASGGPGDSIQRWDWRSASKSAQSVTAKVNKRYTVAKRWQKKLDILTAAYLYVGPHGIVNAGTSVTLN